ncbi:MAG: hypothetical protein IT343_11650 [Candidatus Melainabacteria bacterium]|nr:hypothetical protein [Candidatus Melainabacteria bacterium]
MELEVWESINSRAPERTNEATVPATVNNAKPRFNPYNPVHGSEKSGQNNVR